MGTSQAWESQIRDRELSLLNSWRSLPGRQSGTRQVGTGSVPLNAMFLNEPSLTHPCLPGQELLRLGNIALCAWEGH